MSKVSDEVLRGIATRTYDVPLYSESVAMARELLDMRAKAAAGKWMQLKDAPMYVYGRDALVGEWTGYVWKKISIWEENWARDEILARGGTHWWPHLRDLPAPEAEKP